MQVQLSFMVLLSLICSGFCSDIDQGEEAMAEELLSSLFTSELKPSRHSVPQWEEPLLNVCRMLGGATEPGQGQEYWWGGELHTDHDQKLSPSLMHTLQQLYHLQSLCRVLHPRELLYGQEYLELDQSSETPLKRKSPYILKRQLHTNKSRRPYILKRSWLY